ncbi:MAG: FAD-binding oxidoreductase [Alphaproteobacteria bacterium]|nr:FAD-binding oxidoreductase [Alphaproteobacteria bacterium]MCW5739885.1 FAD-binding oxidoreductase [Alphaproteobacteria bacterium]
MKILVVGAGIIGAAIAWHAARAGARVTVIDAGEPGGAATRHSLAWINASWGNRLEYFRLRMAAMEDWRRLERDLPAIRVGWVGGLLWNLPRDRLEAFAAEHRSWGYDIRLVDGADARRIEPQLASPPDLAVHVAAEGAIEPLDTALALLEAAKVLGVNVIGHTPVRAIDMRDRRVVGVRTDGTRLDADAVIVAAGIGASRLMAGIGVSLPLAARPSLFIATTPREPLLNGIVLAPTMDARQTRDGRIVAAAGIDARDPAEAAQALLGDLQAMLGPGAGLSLASHARALRPIPDDGHPIVGMVDGVEGLYVAVTHSGVTLAPAIGRLVAQELVGGARAASLAPYSPARFRRAG